MSWWLGELAGLATAARAAATAGLTGGGRRTVLFYSSTGLDIHVQGAGKTHRLTPAASEGENWEPSSLRQQLRALGAERAPVILRLAPDQVLEKTISIPAAAEDVLAPVLRNQMQRYAPWPLSETRFGYEIIGRNAAKDQLEIRIVATSRQLLDEALAAAAKTGLAPRLVEQGDSAGADTGIILADLRAPDRRKAKKRIGYWLGGLVALCLLAGGVGLTQLLFERRALVKIESQITKTRSSIEADNRRHDGRAALARQKARLVTRKRQGPSAAGVLETLSRALPDDAWLSSLELKGRLVRLQGKSKNAANLIRIIESAPYYTAARFSAPTTRNGDSDLEAFAITAEVVPGVKLKD